MWDDLKFTHNFLLQMQANLRFALHFELDSNWGEQHGY